MTSVTASRATSDISSAVQGGSQTISTWTSWTPGTARTRAWTSAGSCCADGHIGLVSVMVTWTTASASMTMS